MTTKKGEGERLMIGRIRVLHDGVDGHGFHYGEIWIGGSDIDGLGIDKSYGADEVWATVSVKTRSSYKEAKAALEASASSPSNDMAELAKAKKLVDDAEKDLKLLVDSDLNMAAWGTSNPHINRARRDILTIRGELIRASEKLNLIAHPEKRDG